MDIKVKEGERDDNREIFAAGEKAPSRAGATVQGPQHQNDQREEVTCINT